MCQDQHQKFVSQLGIAFHLGLKIGLICALLLSLYFLYLGPALHPDRTFSWIAIHDTHENALRQFQEELDRTDGKLIETGLEGLDYVHRKHYYTKPTTEFRIPYAVILCPLAALTFFLLLFPAFALLIWIMPSD